MKMKNFALCIYMGIILCTACSSKPPEETVELKRFPINDLEGIVTKIGVEIDHQISSNGAGSLRIKTNDPIVVKLFETGDINVENARLIYQANLRTEDIEGQVFLEMWCHFPGAGEYFSRGLDNMLTGTTDWTAVKARFFLKKGENPDNIKLNLVIQGNGKAWIDDVRLMKEPLQ